MRKTTGIVWLLLGAMTVTSAALAIEGDGHNYGSWITKRKATCTQEGHQFKYCQDCDHWEQRYTSKLPHTADEWVVTKEPTCTQEGVESAHCTVCGGYLRATIDKLGHDWAVTHAETEPTCHEPGYGDQVCQRCGLTKTDTIPRLDHVYGEFTVVQEPSGKQKGLRERTCTLCGDVDSERFYLEGTLYEDMTPNEDVIRMQQMLKDLGYYGGSISSGTFGSLTGKAVAKFQEDNGLEASQVADPDTLTLIKAQWEALTGQSADAAGEENANTADAPETAANP